MRFDKIRRHLFYENSKADSDDFDDELDEEYCEEEEDSEDDEEYDEDCCDEDEEDYCEEDEEDNDAEEYVTYKLVISFGNDSDEEDCDE